MQKRTIIKKIRTIIEKVGQTNSCEMELDCSPIISCIGENVVQLAEGFFVNGVKAILYANGEEVDDIHINYEDLRKDVLEEILFNLENYEVEQDKFMESCKN